MDTEHPPFLHTWAAIPLWVMRGVNLNTNSAYWLPMKSGEFSHEFLYENNDADRLLYRARFMIVLLGILLGVILFGWARELYGFWPAVMVLGFYATEPNIVAHAGLVTTDFGVSCFLFAALYFLWRTTQELTLKHLSGLIVFFALAQVSKFSALALWPMTFLLLLVPALRNSPWPGDFLAPRGSGSRVTRTTTAFLIVALLLCASFAGLWTAYSFRYSPAPEVSGVLPQPGGSSAIEHVSQTASIMDWIDRHHLLPSAYTHGFLLGQERAPKRPSFLAGHMRRGGWWWYFPVAFLVKTPVALLLLFLGGVTLAFVGRNRPISDELFILVPPAVYMILAMVTRLNIGVRHILPIYPFVLLIAGKAIAQLWTSRRRVMQILLATLALTEFGEVAATYPHFLSFFNQFVGGPQNGYKYLADSNLNWGQDLKSLKKWMDQNHVRFINLSYFGSADPAYYGINCAYLPPPLPFTPKPNQEPRFPGYVAFSVQNVVRLTIDPPRRTFICNCSNRNRWR